MAKFEKGDRVYIVPRDEVEDPDDYPSYAEEMECYGGKFCRVTSIDTSHRWIELDIDGGTWFWNPEWLCHVRNEDFHNGGWQPVHAVDSAGHVADAQIHRTLKPQANSEGETLNNDDVMKSIRDACKGF